MSKLIHQITALRTSLREADRNDPNSFSNVFSAFFDILEGPDLIDASDPSEDALVRLLLEQIARAHLRDPSFSLTLIRTLHHRPTELFHGSFFAANTVGTFFYFAQDEQGLLSFIGNTPMTHYYRITATIFSGGGMPMPRPAGKH
jgi:hypothetical protein